MIIEIKEEGGCELYKIYINGKFYCDVEDGVIIDTDKVKL